MQVAEAVHRYGRVLGVRVLPVYGGASMGAQITIASPRASTSSSRRPAAPSTTSAARRCSSPRSGCVVLDEADEMLDMGFAEDLEAILAATPAKKQTALFSATLPPRIARSHAPT